MLYGILLFASIINMFHTILCTKPNTVNLMKLIASGKGSHAYLFKVEESKTGTYIHKSVVYKPTPTCKFSSSKYALMPISVIRPLVLTTHFGLLHEWEAHHFGGVIRIPKLFHQLPPPLSYLCELSILPT